MFQDEVSSLFFSGGLFIFLGVIAIVWDRMEKNRYLSSISHHRDTREFLVGWPKRPQFGALKTGGWIAVSVGLVLLLGGLVFWIWG
jgi:hypothetical protein